VVQQASLLRLIRYPITLFSPYNFEYPRPGACVGGSRPWLTLWYRRHHDCNHVRVQDFRGSFEKNTD
jgi:hypothetical protein